MKRRNFLCISWATFVLGLSCLILVTAEADPAILSNAELGQVQQSRSAFDPRPRLSASQQAQILSDVQQHQQRFRRPNQEHANSRQNSFTNYQQPTTPYPSLAKYKVDRTKQQQIQQLLEQQQQVQQLLLQQQQKIAQQFGPNFLQNAQTQYQAHAAKQEQQLQQQYNNPYHDLPGNYQNLQQDLSHPLFSEQHAVQLQNYLEKQRELELLQKQRQQLLLEQQELRRQQELLRLQQLRQLTSTTQPSLPPSTTTVIPVVVSTTATTPVLLTSPTARKITASETELFLKAIANHQKKYSTTTNKPTSTLKTVASETQDTTTIPENVLSLIQEQERRAIQQGKPKPQIKVIYQTDSPTTTKQNPIIKPRSSQQITDTSDKDLLLKQLKIALAQAADDGVTRNVTTRDIILPNGKKLQVIQAPNDLSSIVPTEGSTSIQTSTQHLSSPSSTIKPPKAIFEELTKGVLPPGADFEIIRQKSDGKLEEIGKTPIQSLPAEKVTFVVLEEQPDGSYKVQGVKGNTEKEGSDVESIVEKIKKGELKLPPSSITPTTAASTSQNFESTIDLISSRQSSPTLQTITALATTFRPAAIRTTSVPSGHSESKGTSEYIPYVTVSPNSVSTTDKYVTSASSVTSHIYNTIGTVGTSSRASSPFDQDTRVTTKYPAATRSSYVPTMAPVSEIITTVPPTIITTFSPTANSFVHFTARQPTESSPASRSISTTSRPLISEQNNSPTYQDVNDRTTVLPTVQPNNKGKTLIHESLTTLLKREGLFAMAKYLRESGLDNVLNETGPYTIFIPTDKAFRTLLVQLGGPEKAEQKFHDNPRLLSGLLLHHVIPGAFRIDSLQDEMTGVSLAGTQLRVNEYAMHDHEWNDVKVTTVNGARVAPNKRDIEIPQGIAHAIDRVMFPLPVGDLVQTLQADRERRFTIFLKMLHVSNLEHTLTGPKTFTIFAPTDAAFASSASKHGNSVWTEDDGPESAKAIVSKHIIPSTLYSAGMRYYLQKETLRPQMPLHIHKNGGRVRINEVNVVTHNVPATNGVLHAIDGVL